MEILRLSIPQIKLIVIGEGTQRILFQKEVQRKNLVENIITTGSQPDEEIIRYYSNSRILVFPSPEESLGYVALEAQTSGLPVMAFENNGSSRWCINNTSGFLVHGNSPSQLAKKILEVISDDTLLIKISETAKRNIIEERYNATNKNITEVYSSLIQC